MIPDTGGKAESEKIDPGQLAKVLELELLQKRSQWQKAKTRNQNLRTFAILFLFVVIAAGLAAFFFVFSRFH